MPSIALARDYETVHCTCRRLIGNWIIAGLFSSVLNENITLILLLVCRSSPDLDSDLMVSPSACLPPYLSIQYHRQVLYMQYTGSGCTHETTQMTVWSIRGDSRKTLSWPIWRTSASRAFATIAYYRRAWSNWTRYRTYAVLPSRHSFPHAQADKRRLALTVVIGTPGKSDDKAANDLRWDRIMFTLWSPVVSWAARWSDPKPWRQILLRIFLDSNIQE